MRLDELVITGRNRSNYVRHLKDTLNIEHLGAGFSADVFAHPVDANIAVKVVDDGDITYLKYVDWIKQHPNNPFVPKIYGVEDVKIAQPDDEEVGYKIIFMEKLRNMSQVAYERFIMKTFGTPAEDLTEDDVKQQTEIELDLDLKELLEFITSFEDSTDFHSGNFMLRGNQVVFVDPLATMN